CIISGFFCTQRLESVFFNKEVPFIYSFVHCYLMWFTTLQSDVSFHPYSHLVVKFNGKTKFLQLQIIV
ncbi:MAG TPA: hypothetical protein VHD35_11575, partial [Chitinophagaceae bacterium]|nr:hypothetical protein [Chitinophagaceae bacterium]